MPATRPACRTAQRRALIAAALGAATLTLGAPAAHAQAYPSRPVMVIEPFAAGGAVDAGVRAIAEKASQLLGQTLVIDAKPGAGTRLGTDAIRRARPDGYTIGVMVSASGINIPALDPKAGYDPLRDFTLLTIAFESNFLIVTNPGTGIRTVEQLVAAGKAQPGKLSYGSSGVGTSSHMWVEIFQSVTGTSYTHIPYKGEAASLQDVGGGHLQFVFTNASLAKPLVDSGKVVPVAYAAPQRTPLFPQVPTVDETGWKGFNAGGWVAFIAPAGLPADVTQKISAALQEAMRAPEVREKIRSLGFTLVASSPEAFAQRLRSEFETLRAVGQARKIVIND
jgi:tripartite-type tricarboxylate transporter receptor subunit TctC